MKVLHFRKKDFKIIAEALEVAEDLTANFYKFSTSEWKNKHKYDLKTLIALNRHQVINNAFALLCRDTIKVNSIPQRITGVYLICLQDHVILKTLLRDRNLSLFPFLVYILTHELVHIVRFCNYYAHFNASQSAKVQEEITVNAITFDILKSVMIPNLSYVLNLFCKNNLVTQQQTAKKSVLVFGAGAMDGQKPPGGADHPEKAEYKYPTQNCTLVQFC